MTKIKGIIFDFDGIIILSEDIHRKIFNELYKKVGKIITDELWFNKFQGAGSKNIFKYGIETLNLKFNKTIPELIEDHNVMYLNYLKTEVAESPTGLREFIKFIQNKNIKIIIASSGHKNNIYAALKNLNLENFNPEILSSEDVNKVKPDPEIFTLACHKLNLKPKECIVLEDSCFGIQASNSANCHTIALETTTPLEKLQKEKTMILTKDFKTLLENSIFKELFNNE